MEIIEAKHHHNQLYKWVLILAVLTIVYNIAEGFISIYFGLKDDTLTLFGFGADSLIETISAVGVTQMVFRIKWNPRSDRSQFEISALRITGWCFYILSGILCVTALVQLIEGKSPTSTIAGVIIACISILVMWALIWAKISLGRKLNSAAIIADAKCNQVCVYMSLILLAASGLWWLWKIPYVDTLGTLGIVYFSIKEGHEAFNKAHGLECDAC